MVRFKVEPYSRVTVRSYTKHKSPEEFVDALLSASPRRMARVEVTLLWANGVLFRHYPFAQTDSVSREYLSGNLPWDTIEFAPMPKYKPEIRREDRDVFVAVQDVSNNSLFNQVTKAIKKAYL